MVDFLVIGPVLNSTYKNMFHLIKDGDISFGWNIVVEFDGGFKFGNIRWFSNISDYCPPPLVLKKNYRLDDYKRFDERPDIINIDRKNDIPDYDGLMGVPVSAVRFLDRREWNILGVAHRGVVKGDLFTPYVDGEFKCTKWIIRRRKDG